MHEKRQNNPIDKNEQNQERKNYNVEIQMINKHIIVMEIFFKKIYNI